MTATHFDPYADSDGDIEFAPCGVRVGDEYHASNSFSEVTCGRCQKQKDNLTRKYAENERLIIDQMGDMADFFNRGSGNA